ncbi:glucosaminidase domain-containing protein [Dysgonomonas termitidis]|uniref:Glucosaminidase domain-containing protein n=1 Tax=Dysgonomonas termitidis TaxID=1516126 RepID=A0ABV9L6C9_9BACT
MATGKQQTEFVRTIYPAAYRLHMEKPEASIHPVFETAQAGLEKGWLLGGKLPYNLFGITKGTSWDGPVERALTTEYFDTPDKKFVYPERVVSVTPHGSKYKYSVYRYFRAYKSYEECLYDHQAIFRKTGYADAWPYRDEPREFARRLMDSEGWKYATADNYVPVITSCIAMVEKIMKNEE